MNKFIRSIQQVIVGLFAIVIFNAANATDLADQPLAVSRNVANNVALALSVEFPTALGSAYTTAYVKTNTYLGYFNPDMCYTYKTDTAIATDLQPDVRHYFMPSESTKDHTCQSKWSGNFLNWALTQTIDPFRFALTGGYRVVDEVGLTILEKAYASGQGGTVATPTIYDDADLISKSTPFNVKNITIRIGKAGTSFIISTCDPKAAEHTGTRPNPNDNTKTIAKPSCIDYINTVKTAKDIKPAIPAISSDKDIALINPVADTAIPTTVGDNEYYALHAAVRVCVPDEKLRESNCVQYGNDYKPEGLIQKNSLKLNFAAFGYAVTDQRDTVHVNNVLPQNGDIDGGVLRAKMSPLGPLKSVPNAPNVTNPRPEWSATTGIFDKNPAPTDAAASGVANSGVINYLNKFGKSYGDASAAKGYKRLDSVGELYYTVLRYFKNLGPVASYSSNLNAEMKDDFPVITDWNDPVGYECQKQFIIGVGDTNSWLDASLPGSTITTKEGHAIPPEVDADKTIDVRLATNQVGLMQDGTTNLGELFQSNSRYNTFFIAGMAYDAHTKDIRPGDTFKGDQTITTYWLDVLESGFIGANRNQYYLAAKFGGFEVPKGYDPYAAKPKALTTSQWDKNGDGDPDNYYRANNPALMIKGLNAAFDDAVKDSSGASSVLSLTSSSVSDGDVSYGSSFVVKDNDIDVWTGEVTASTVPVDKVTGNISPPIEQWAASKKLEAKTADKGWDLSRIMATATCEVNDTVTLSQTCTGVAFRYDKINTSMQKAIVDNDRLEYLRGNRSKEGTYRIRKQILGDIVNSQVVPVGTPSAPYSDTFNVGYKSFKDTHSRQTVVYVGGNDGFLHAFNGGKSGGDELFAYSPNALFYGPNNTPSVDGLAALSNTAFVHHYYVDSTPVVQDVNFSTSLSDWHTLLIGGLGKGGKAYYCLDVTNPSALATEEGLAKSVKWEFKNANLGYTYGQPAIVKVKLSNGSKKWVVIITSGYNNADKQGHFFILDPATGNLIQDIPTGDVPGVNETEAGMSQVTAYVADKRDWTADAAYAADLKGNVWRLDLSGKKNSLGSYAKPTRIISVGQPITVPPVVEVDQTTLKRYVFVGTGKFLAITDINTTQDNAIYAFNDGSNVAFYDSSTAPVAFPWGKSNLVLNADVTAVSTNQSSTVIGYYIPIGDYRVNIPMKSAGGIIVVGANIPTGSDCQPDGKGRLYAFSYGTGASALISSSGNNQEKTTLSYQSTDQAIAGVGLVKDSAGNLRISANVDRSLKIFELSQGATGSVILLNWRELPTNN